MHNPIEKVETLLTLQSIKRVRSSLYEKHKKPKSMFYSHSYNEEAFEYFASFLNNVILGNMSYKDVVTPIISDAHKLATGEKDFYKIDRRGYSIIVYLVEKEKKYFQALDVNNLSKENYLHILGLVRAQKDLFVS